MPDRITAVLNMYKMYFLNDQTFSLRGTIRINDKTQSEYGSVWCPGLSITGLHHDAIDRNMFEEMETEIIEYLGPWVQAEYRRIKG
ncbi:hypothetical protein TFV6.5 [Tiger frog virus]|uniref:Uncharacterized protein n=1 Tax=Rana tigrina ranavirus TaxID=160691 RepID=A0A8A4YLF9_RTRV|nr:hypothetical protein TFV6.5 [Tiger frog virus]